MEKIIKTKKRIPKSFQYAWGCREIAEKIWGDLKIADSFLYLYRRFGTPCADTGDEYKISYEYQFWYKGLFFVIGATTPEFVLLDCFFPKKYHHLQKERYDREVRSVFEAAYKDDVLCYPWSSGFFGIDQVLTKGQKKRYAQKFDRETRDFFDKETYDWLAMVSKNHDVISDEGMDRFLVLMNGFRKHLQNKFKRWAEGNSAINTLFYSVPDLRDLPEIKEIIEEFCRRMLETEPVRDCNINIRGWQ